MEIQLRRYQIAEGRLDQFASEWRAGVVPLRQRFGFTFLGAWALPDSGEFVWVVAYEGEGTFAEADARYYASSERHEMDPDPADLIVRTNHSWAVPAM